MLPLFYSLDIGLCFGLVGVGRKSVVSFLDGGKVEVAVGGTLEHDFKRGPPSQASLWLRAIISQEVGQLVIPVVPEMSVGAHEGF